jgi:hypothetical protein
MYCCHRLIGGHLLIRTAALFEGLCALRRWDFLSQRPPNQWDFIVALIITTSAQSQRPRWRDASLSIL